MWPRLALRLLFPIFVFSACSPSVDRQAVDKLNSLSYAYHYRDIDSTEHLARRALTLSDGYADGRAEALNNLAFVALVRMQYAEAERLLDEVSATTDNQVELLVGHVQHMRLCQRMSRNRAFYDFREKARQSLLRLSEEADALTDRQRQRLYYAETEMAIVTSTYYYYVGLERQASEALDIHIDEVGDTAQLLNYLYNVGSGGIVASDTQEEINQVEFDHLMRCFLLSQQNDYPYFMANSLEALAEHLATPEYRHRLVADNLPAMKFLNPNHVDDDSLPAWLADWALSLFSDYGDVYQIAGAYRTLASCCLASSDYDAALGYLDQALADTAIMQAPDLVASIYEQLSVAYAAIDDKAHSDNYRNLYLDLQEQTRQDRSLEARAGQLEQSAAQLNRLLVAVVVAIVALLLLVWGTVMWRRRRSGRPLDASLLDRRDELQERLSIAALQVEQGQRRHLEQRAKISLVNSITPFIDRIIHEVRRLDEGETSGPRVDYIRELTDKINEQNDVLTSWIQLHQGELSLHIETFALNDLFDIVAKGQRSFLMKGVELDVRPTAARVKADRVLTLFMLNTLADNARKFTPAGGHVSIYADEQPAYVEISVADDGEGMDAEALSRVFDHKISGGHGFGLLNCKGIIEKYRKLSQIFAVCLLSAESEKGQGSRFFFRLPKGVVKTFLAMLMFTAAATSQAQEPLARASIYADSAYFSNINGTYERTLRFADSCRHQLNIHYLMQPGAQPADTMTAMGDPSVVASEVEWLHRGIQTNYDLIVDIRNESAVAALALHRWQLYNYNNRICTQLTKELSADSGLAAYCRKMQKSEADKRIAILLLVVLLLAMLAAVGWQLLALFDRSARRQQAFLAELELMEDELQSKALDEAALHVSNAVLDNCLSTLKHETMYYPSRIRQLLDQGDTRSLAEVAAYYRELYGILSEQAQRQVEHVKLHLRPLDHDILGDEVLIRQLFDILRRQSQRQMDVSYEPRDQKYVVCRVNMPRLRLSEAEAAALFTPSIKNIPYLLCRQIVRDHGEATNRRGCAIRAEASPDDGSTTIIITLPRIWTNSKSSS
ncbi:MAG: DUF5112 domain-containing protein [Prevotella sp.]|nr:DUF5112 domain-containing protein [Prevotella sp.]